MSVAISIRNLTKSFGSHMAVKDVTFDVKKGEIFGFLGPNGAGKTTTIRCIMDFIRPDNGEVQVAGLDSRANGVELKRAVGYVSSDYHLTDRWTAREHIEYVKSLRGEDGEADELVKQFSLDLDRRVKVLSTGNRQKLNIILGLIGQPKVLILDEPTQGLDPLFQNEVYRVLAAFKAAGGTVFISSHNLAEVQRICDRVGIIRQGELVAVESLKSLIEKTRHVVRARFTKPVARSVFENENTTIQHHSKNEVRLLVKGSLDPVIKSFAKHSLTDLEITHASLEEVFLEMYS